MSLDTQTLNRQGHGGGPKTADGKRRVSRNAITHGLTCADVLLPGEDSAEFGDLRAAMLAETQPIGAQEQHAVERMIASEWKLRRLWRQEGEVYAFNRFRLKDPKAGVGVCLLKDMMHQNAFTQLQRHEAHLDRMYTRAAKRLQELQDMRRRGLRHVIDEEADATSQPAQAVQTLQTAASPPAAPVHPPTPAEQGMRDATLAAPSATPAAKEHPVSYKINATHSVHGPSGKNTKQTSGAPGDHLAAA